MKTQEFIQNDWTEIKELFDRIKEHLKQHPNDIILLSQRHKRKDDTTMLKSIKFVPKNTVKIKFSKKEKLHLGKDEQGKLTVLNDDKKQTKQNNNTRRNKQKKERAPSKTMPS